MFHPAREVGVMMFLPAREVSVIMFLPAREVSVIMFLPAREVSAITGINHSPISFFYVSALFDVSPSQGGGCNYVSPSQGGECNNVSPSQGGECNNVSPSQGGECNNWNKSLTYILFYVSALFVFRKFVYVCEQVNLLKPNRYRVWFGRYFHLELCIHRRSHYK